MDPVKEIISKLERNPHEPLTNGGMADALRQVVRRKTDEEARTKLLIDKINKLEGECVRMGSVGSELSEKSEQIKRLQKEIDELRKLKQELRTALDRVTSERDGEKQRADSLVRQAEEVKVLQNLEQRMWPECIRVKELEAFRGEWAKEILSSTPDRVLMLMFANIFAWSSAYSICEAGEEDDSIDLTATTSLFNFSKALFKWLSDHGHSYQEAHTIFDSIAESLNTRMKGGRYRIEVPSLDSPYASKSMIPSRSGTSSGSVEAVEAWAILSSTGNYCINKASVKLTH